jgi:preprotein translocase subunit SecA
MLSKLKTAFDLNAKQIKNTEGTFKKIKEQSEVWKNKNFEDMQKRINEMKEELKPLVEKVPDEAKLSLSKFERTKGLPGYEKAIQDKLFEFLPEVYAMMDEIFFRKMNIRFHDIQFKTGIILAQGQRLTELYTGEGKTMTFMLPLMLYSLVGRGSHLVTVNDYLTRIGGEYAGHIASELGISVGIIAPQVSYKFISDAQLKDYKGEEGVKSREGQKMQIDSMTGVNLIECEKREAYACDITYGTNNEFGFDYLRDNMAWNLEQLVQRELYFCIIDEADSILIDEARTPLIISGIPSESDTEKYSRFAGAVNDLIENEDFVIEYKGGENVTLTEKGISKVENTLGVDNLWSDYSMAYHIENALRARTLYQKDDRYIIKNGEVLIVDEFTGRVMKGRRYSEGLHQAIEAKEGVEIKQESKTFATITFQNFFRIYKILCGGSGTIMTEAEEFFKIYGLESIEIPTNKPNIRKDHADRIYRNQEAKFKAVVEEIKEAHKKGQPVLIGTTSVEKSEYLSKLLDEEEIPHEVLNAKYHEQEARIVAQAGRKSAVTVATNMAGRGTDIVLGGGSRGDDAWKEGCELGGLYVIGTERHEARRVDNQLRGRSGRQGEPGQTRFFVALDDQIMKVLGGDIIARLMNFVKTPDDVPIELKMISKQIETAQKRLEGSNFDVRKRLVEYDDVMNQHREIFYSRRRDFLETTENALGKFFVSGQVVDFTLPENSEKKKEFENTIQKNQEEIRNVFSEMIDDQIDNIVNEYLTENNKTKSGDHEKLLEKFSNLLPESLAAKTLEVSTLDLSKELLNKVKGKNVDEAEKVLKDLVQKAYKIKLEEFKDDFYYLAKVISLQTMDNKWVDHLEIMTDLRHGIGLQGYAQKDPLVEYKNKSFEIFDSFIKTIDAETARQILKIKRVEKETEKRPVSIKTNVSEVKDIATGTREMITTKKAVSPDQMFQKKVTRDEAKAMLKKMKKKK